MDYKYIEQLLERYWDAESTVEEEEMLRTFFRQTDIPAHLKRYRSLFVYEDKASEVRLGADFDAKVLARVEHPVVAARTIGWRHRLSPFFKAAAAVAIVLTLSTAVQHSLSPKSDPVVDYNYAGYKDTYTDPEVAYDEVSTALRSVADGLRAAMGDSAKSIVPPASDKRLNR